jgi:hypothetical protein
MTHARLHLAAYRALVRLAPRAHRERFGAEQEQLFADLLASGAPAGRLWAGALPDLADTWRGRAPSRLALVPAGGGLVATHPDFARDGRLPARRPAATSAASRRMLESLATHGAMRGRELAAAARAADPALDDTGAWQALVDVTDAGLVADEAFWGWAPIDARMRVRYTLTDRGRGALAEDPTRNTTER